MDHKIRESVLRTWKIESEEIVRLTETVDENVLETDAHFIYLLKSSLFVCFYCCTGS